jgi:hypothetical protein
MTRSLFASGCLFLTLAVSNIFADDSTKAAKVEEFLKLAKIDDTQRQTVAQIRAQMQLGILQQLFGSKPLPTDKKKELDEFRTNLGNVISDALSWEKLKPDFVKIYMEAFSEPEIDGMLAFYKSPVGQAMVAKTPALTTKGSELSQQKLVGAEPAIDKVVRDLMAAVGVKPAQ